MLLPRLKAGYFFLTAAASVASSYYFNYLFFFLRDRYGFNNRDNLTVAAMHGAIYIVASWQAGRFAERRGFHTSLKVGFSGLVVVLTAGSFVDSVPLHVLVLATYTVSVCFLWPAIEALVTQYEPPGRVPHMIGVYNTVWSTAAAGAYFTGGGLYDWIGKGALFAVPAATFLSLLVFVYWLDRRAADVALPEMVMPPSPPHPDPLAYSQPVAPQVFLRLAWIANPFSYVAIYTLLATMPTIAEKFELSPARVGLFCSVWLFGRLVAFVALWNWTGWHYRFRFLGGGFALLAASFVVILTAASLWIVVAAEVVFGLACGLMYYSSLFYSMDIGDAKAEHGGLHEAAIGAGICGGPAVGALSLYLFPNTENASAVAVSGFLVAGLVLLGAIWARGRR
jgi:predicted MFS family arabinose efflux permease